MIMRAIKVIFGAVALVALLIVSSCTYLSFMPHLLLNPITRTLVNAQAGPTGWWRSVEVDLIPSHFQPGMTADEFEKAVLSAGFSLSIDYENPPPPRQNAPDFTDLYRQELQQGVTRVYGMSGRFTVACGERLILSVGIHDGRLTRATGHSSWGCL